MTDQLIDNMQTITALEEGISFQDFLQKYDGQSVEWHAGKVFTTVSNNITHQRIIKFLSSLIGLFVEIHEIGEMILAGFPMYISDKVPARQPDIMVVLNEHRDRIHHNFFEGPVDIAVEIVSPGSERVDRGEKFIEYEEAGVPEYWLFDPIRKEANIYALNDEGHYQRVPLDEKDRLVSTILNGFVLSPDVLWKENLPNGTEIMDMVKAMTTR